MQKYSQLFMISVKSEVYFVGYMCTADAVGPDALDYTLFELMLYVPAINSNGHVGTLPSFYWTLPNVWML